MLHAHAPALQAWDASHTVAHAPQWFASIADVPSHAVSMSVHQILASREIIAVVPDARKAEAVRACFEGDISPMAPASILRRHANTVVYLDRDSAALLAPSIRGDILADDAP